MVNVNFTGLKDVHIVGKTFLGVSVVRVLKRLTFESVDYERRSPSLI